MRIVFKSPLLRFNLGSFSLRSKKNKVLRLVLVSQPQQLILQTVRIMRRKVRIVYVLELK